MSSTYRLDRIYSLLLRNGRATVEDLAQNFHVTPTTIRRDLLLLEERGLIYRTRGYANILNTDDTINVFDTEKRRIAEAAMSFIQEEMTVAMDSGTTVEAICDCLVEKNSVRVLDIVTHSLKVAMRLGEYYRVSMPGGVMMSRYNALVGMDVENFYQNINVDIAFLGTTGINNCNGLTVSDPLQLEVKKRCVGCAAKRIAVANSSKYIRRGIYVFCDFSEIDTLITVKTEENAHQLEQIAKKGVDIVLV